MRLHAGAEHWLLEISLDERDPEKKGIRYRWRLLPLYMARKVQSKTGNTNGRDYEGLLRRVMASGDPYPVEILRRQGRYQVRITVEEEPATWQTYPANGRVGVDTNVTFLALCHVQPDGNPQEFTTLGDNRLYDARATQRDAIFGDLTHQAVRWAKDRGAALVIENLKFIYDKNISAKFNWVAHQFTSRAFLMALERRTAREGVEVRKVKPAAALVIGRRGGLKVWRENVPKGLREWMQDRGKWHDTAYRQADWSTWNKVTQEMKIVLLKKSSIPQRLLGAASPDLPALKHRTTRCLP